MSTSTSYPQTTVAAQKFARTLQQVIAGQMPKGEGLEVATIIDTSNHPQGYCVGTTGKAHVRIFGIPYPTVVPGMRVYVRSVIEHGILRTVYVTQAPAVQVGFESGSYLVQPPNLTGNQLYNSGIFAWPVLSSAGYYWSFFLYLASLPTSDCTIFDIVFSDSTPHLYCTYTTQGYLKLTQNNVSYQSAAPLPPHNVYHIVWQLGPGTNWSPLLVNGSSSQVVGGAAANPNTALTTGNVWNHIGGSSDIAFTLGAGAGSTDYYLSTSSGIQVPPAGTWISKVSFGYSYANGAPFAPITSLPQDDDMLPFGTASFGQGVTTLYQFLMSDSVGIQQAINSTAYNAYPYTSAFNAASAIAATGPY